MFHTVKKRSYHHLAANLNTTSKLNSTTIMSKKRILFLFWHVGGKSRLSSSLIAVLLFAVADKVT